MISTVCIYNNEKILSDFLLKSLENQTVDFELIKINNTRNKFKSAAEALNYGGKNVKSEYIMFAHQDVYLLADNWLEKAEIFLRKISDLGVAGVAGTREIGNSNIKRYIGVVYHGSEKEPWRGNKNFEEPVEVQTLDEQILIVAKNVFNTLKFDEKTCDGWHIYGADFCLSAREFGLKSYVLPLPVWHRSEGTNNEDYYKVLHRFLKKHRQYKKIFLTSGEWRSNDLFNYLSLLRMAIKSEIGKWLGRNNVGAIPYFRGIKFLLKARNE
jgi:hypothetical protein